MTGGPPDVTPFAAISYWLQFSDFYVLPGVLTFSSFDEVVDILRTTDLFGKCPDLGRRDEGKDASDSSQHTNLLHRLHITTAWADGGELPRRDHADTVSVFNGLEERRNRISGPRN